MIYVTRSLPLDRLADHSDPSKRLRMFDRELDDMARDRGRAELLRLQRAGRLLPPEGQRLHGDVVMVMVDPGEGDEAARLIAEKLSQ